MLGKQDELHDNNMIFDDVWNLKVAEEHTFKAEKINQHLSTKWNIINSINMLTFSNILYAK